MTKDKAPSSASAVTSGSDAKFYPKAEFNSRTDLSTCIPEEDDEDEPERHKDSSPVRSSGQRELLPEVYVKPENLDRGLLDSDHEEDEEDDEDENVRDEEEGADTEKSDKSIRKKSIVRQYGGMAITLVGSVVFSLVILLAKILQDYDFRPSGLSFWRYAGSMIPTIPLIVYYECTERRKAARCETAEEKAACSVFYTVWPLNERDNWKTVIGLLVRGILGNAAQILRFFALEYLTVGDTSVISNSSPVLVTILAHFLLGEQTGFVPILTAIVALSGVFIIIRPPILTGQKAFDTNTLIGAGFASGSLLCSALVTILMRKVRKVHVAPMVLIFALVGMAQAFILTQILGHFHIPRGYFDILLVCGVSMCSFLGQICTILGLKMETASVVSLIRTADVVFGFLLQFIVLGVVPDHFSSIGGSIVFFGILVIAFRKYVFNLPEGSPRRRFWGFLLH